VWTFAEVLRNLEPEVNLEINCLLNCFKDLRKGGYIGFTLEDCCFACCLLHAGFLLGLLFNPYNKATRRFIPEERTLQFQMLIIAAFPTALVA
jgi:hypothetical protein